MFVGSNKRFPFLLYAFARPSLMASMTCLAPRLHVFGEANEGGAILIYCFDEALSTGWVGWMHIEIMRNGN